MIYRSPLADVEIPVAPLHEYVLENADRWSGKPALVDGATGRSLSFGDLRAGVRSVAAGLAARGFGKGDVCALCSPNLPEFVVAFLGVSAAGGVVTTMNPLYTSAEMSRQLANSGAKLFLTVPGFLPAARQALESTSFGELFVFGEGEGATPFSALMAEGEPPAPALDPRSDLVALPYSSGTTGRPKGVMLTHHNIVSNVAQLNAVEELTESDTMIGILPFFHIYGMTAVMAHSLRVGATIVTQPRFELEQFLGILQQYRVTVAYLVPPIILALAKHPLVDRYDLSALRHIVSGAAPLPESVARGAAERNHVVVRQGYGLTEASPVTHLHPPEGDIRMASIGPPLPNTECRLVDPQTGADVAQGQRGEVWVRGPQVMKGYLHNPEATRAMIDHEGWLHTGDLGVAGGDGYFSIVDRLKELIKYKGMQVAPAVLEAILHSHPDVADAAVIPSPDPEAGEVPKAFVVLRASASANADALMAYVAGKVAPHEKVRRLEFVDTIPKSPSGKILRRVLVEQERARPSGDDRSHA